MAEENKNPDVAAEEVEAEATQGTAQEETSGSADTRAGEAAAQANAEATDDQQTDAFDETEEAPAEDAPEEEKKSWAEKMAAKKAAKVDKKEEALKGQIADLQDRVMRQMAEFENFRKRSEKEKQSMHDMGAVMVLTKILPVVDNFERGIATVPEDKKDDPFVDGMIRIYKQLVTEMENMGVKEIEAVGQPFDPNRHNAVMQVESDEYESGTVAQVLQKGYIYNDTVIRYSMVSVVQ